MKSIRNQNEINMKSIGIQKENSEKSFGDYTLKMLADHSSMNESHFRSLNSLNDTEVIDNNLIKI